MPDEPRAWPFIENKSQQVLVPEGKYRAVFTAEWRICGAKWEIQNVAAPAPRSMPARISPTIITVSHLFERGAPSGDSAALSPGMTDPDPWDFGAAATGNGASENSAVPMKL